MEITTPEQAQEAIASAVARATDRYLATLTGGADPIRFAAILKQPLPPMVGRVFRSVEESFWRRELDRRQRDMRFQYNDSSLREVEDMWNAHLRATMVVTTKELRQLLGRALTLQMEAIVAPVECLKMNYFAREEKITAKNAVIIAKHLGLEERYVRALTFMAQDDGNQTLDAEDFRRIVKDVDAKEHAGSQDLAALASLGQAMLVLGLRTEDEPGDAPVDLVSAFILVRGTPAGLEKLREATEGTVRADLIELQNLFAGKQPAREAQPAKSVEEVSRFLEEIGADSELIGAAEASGVTGGVRFVLTDEEKQAYVARAVGRQVHLIAPIMKTIEGALTWEEVDRAISEMVPDNVREEDLSARSFKYRIRTR